MELNARPTGGIDMKEITRRLSEELAEHRHDRVLDEL
jgi:hypothetical protein